MNKNILITNILWIFLCIGMVTNTIDGMQRRHTNTDLKDFSAQSTLDTLIINQHLPQKKEHIVKKYPSNIIRKLIKVLSGVTVGIVGFIGAIQRIKRKQGPRVSSSLTSLYDIVKGRPIKQHIDYLGRWIKDTRWKTIGTIISVVGVIAATINYMKKRDDSIIYKTFYIIKTYHR